MAKCAGDLVTAKEGKIVFVASMWNRAIGVCDPTIDIHLYTLFRSSYNTLGGLYALVLAKPHAFTLRSLATVIYAVHILDNHIYKCTYEPAC